jgi:predicted alpha-1,6-mannanase (GH76 family)
MRFIFLILSCLLFAFNCAFSQIDAGKAYKINSCFTGNKSLSLPNSSLEERANVIAWTETNVPAQRWIASEAGENLFFLTNAYSGIPISESYTRPKAGDELIQKSNNEAYSKWEFVPVGSSAFPDAYYIRFFQASGSGNLYMDLTDNSEGAQVRLQTKRTDADSLRQMWTVVAEEVLPNRVTPSLRDSVMAGWKNRYFNWLKSETTGFWGEAEMLETILDAYETTGKSEYRTMFEDAYAHFVSGNGGWGVKGNGKDWRWNSYNDDIAWATLASVRAYLLFGSHPNTNIDYLNIGKQNFDWMYNRALLPGGTLRWNEDPAGNRGSNSCINGPAEVAACYLAIATGNDSYYEKAKNLYAKQRQILYDPNTGKVFDAGSWNEAGTSFTVGNTWVSTYNQGTFLGAALMLYKRYGTEQYRTDAHKIVEWTRKDLCSANGVIKVCGNNDDLQGFKGILMRYLRRYVVDLALPDEVAWLQRNALHAYNNRNSKGITWTAWWNKAPESFVYSDGYNFSNKPFGSSTVVSAAFNAPLSPDLIIKDAFRTIEAENFDYLKGVFVERTNDTTAVVSNIFDNYYTSYSNVDFGAERATGVDFFVQGGRPAGRQIEIRLDSLTGTLLGVVTIPVMNTGEWATVSCPVTVDGRHNIYLVYKGNGFKVDNFRFRTETTGVRDLPVSPLLKVYPNPASTDLYVSYPQSGWLNVFNSTGKCVYSANISPGITILNVEDYESGVYFVNAYMDTDRSCAKFLKK